MGTGTDLADRFFASNGASYDRIANLCTLGLDIWWKHKILAMIPDNPSCVIDKCYAEKKGPLRRHDAAAARALILQGLPTLPAMPARYS